MFFPVHLLNKVVTKVQEFTPQCMRWNGRLIGGWQPPALLLIFLPAVEACPFPSGQMTVSPQDSNITQIIPWSTYSLSHLLTCNCIANSTGMIQEIMQRLAARVNASTSVATTFETIRLQDTLQKWEVVLEKMPEGIFTSILHAGSCNWDQHYCVEYSLDDVTRKMYDCMLPDETAESAWISFAETLFIVTLVGIGARFCISQWRKPSINIIAESRSVADLTADDII